MADKKITDRATQFALDVLAGKVIAGKYVKLAARRHLDDIEKSKKAIYRYYFDVEESEKIIDFAETLVIAEGVEEKTVICFPFQCFILGSLNGWKAKDGGYRRFRTSYVQMGRKNGKTFINAILATYYGNFDGYRYGQLYCTATKTDQAKIAFKEICKFIRADSDLEEFFVIHEHSSTIDCLLTDSTMRALSGDTKSIDGFQPYFAIVDEYHAHPTDQMYKLLEGGIKLMDSALISVITTAGFEQKSPCYKLYETCRNLLDGVFENDSQFVFIAQMDEGDDERDPLAWMKANPMLEYMPKAVENLKPIAATAFHQGGDALRDFVVKQLNKWVQYGSRKYFKDISKFIRCGKEKRKLAQFRGKRCFVGLDLSQGGDLTSIALVIPFVEDGRKKYYIYSHSFMPSARLAEHIKTDDAPYDIWAQSGLLTLTETLGGIKTDYKYILSHLSRLVKEYELTVSMICYDPHNASAFLGDLEALGYDSLCITQSHKNLGDATADFRLETEAGNVIYDGENGLLTWSAANAETVSNSYGEIKIDKDTAKSRIDPIDAVIDAWTEAMRDEYKPNADAAVDDWLEMISNIQKRS